MTTYENILAAMGKPDYEKQAQNYKIFDELVKKGVFLEDIVKKAEETDDLRAKIAELESKTSPVNRELFSVMEKSVEDCENVRKSKENLTKLKNIVLMELVRADERYKKAEDEYRALVNEEYVKKKESK